MGQVLNVNCTKCDYHQELFVGGGLQDCEEKTILSALPEETQTQLSQTLTQGATELRIDRLPCVCGACGTFYAVPVVTYEWKGKHDEVYGICPKCGAKEQKLFSPDAEKINERCPVCGAEVSLTEAGHWD